MPSTIAEKRLLFRAASRSMARISGFGPDRKSSYMLWNSNNHPSASSAQPPLLARRAIFHTQSRWGLRQESSTGRKVQSKVSCEYFQQFFRRGKLPRFCPPVAPTNAELIILQREPHSFRSGA